MAKRLIILLTFIAYSLTLVHSLVPHHHHVTAESHSHGHHSHAGHNDHHHTKDHHQEDQKNLCHPFADAIHHLAAEQAIYSAQSEYVPKDKILGEYLTRALEQILLPEQRPPDHNTSYQADHYSFNLFSISLLRAPPAA